MKLNLLICLCRCCGQSSSTRSAGTSEQPWENVGTVQWISFLMIPCGTSSGTWWVASKKCKLTSRLLKPLWTVLHQRWPWVQWIQKSSCKLKFGGVNSRFLLLHIDMPMSKPHIYILVYECCTFMIMALVQSVLSGITRKAAFEFSPFTLWSCFMYFASVWMQILHPPQRPTCSLKPHERWTDPHSRCFVYMAFLVDITEDMCAFILHVK